MFAIRLLLLSCSVFLMLGCSETVSTSPQLPTEEASLKDLAAMLKHIAEQKKKPPLKVADLDPYEPLFMSACKGITANKIVYVWGSGIIAGDTEVIAYESAIDSAGGYVLLKDGTVKQMSASEFGSAKKATKK
jgi:hypothetical protein